MINVEKIQRCYRYNTTCHYTYYYVCQHCSE